MKELIALRDVLSKFESQVLRDPGLPEAYRTILRKGWEAIRSLEAMFEPAKWCCDGKKAMGDDPHNPDCPYHHLKWVAISAPPEDPCTQKKSS